MRFLFLLLLPFALFADQVDNSRENYFLQETPDALLPRVDPASGTYIEEEMDLCVAGVEPISARRFYCSLAPLDDRYGNWMFNPETYLVANFEWNQQEQFVSTGSTLGGVLKLAHGPSGQFVCHSQVSNPALLGEYHPLNTKVDYWKIGDRKNGNRFQWAGTITDGAGVVRSFCSPMHEWFRPKRVTKTIVRRWGGGEQTTIYYQPHNWTPYWIPIQSAKLPNGNSLHYDYEDWKDGSKWPRPPLLKAIRAQNKNGEPLGAIHFAYGREKKKPAIITQIRITGSDHRQVVIAQSFSGSVTLSRASRPGQPPVSYSYRGRQLIAVTLPDGRSYTTQYDNQGRVASQSGPLGPLATYRYFADHTIITDGEGRQTLYRFDNARRTTAIERADSIERNTWSADGDLLRHEICDKQGKVLTFTAYKYKNHNPIEQRTPDHTIFRSFHENRIIEEINGNKRTTYLYDGSLLLEEKVYDKHTLCKHTRNRYDASASLIESEIVGERITHIQPKKELPCRGLPEIVTEEDSQGRQIKRTIYTYTPFGKIESEQHFDAHNIHRYTLLNTYQNEQLATTTNALGITTHFTYDANHKLTSITQGDHTKHLAYDLEGRVTHVTDGELVTSYTYNRVGEKISERDPAGNTTHYSYDNMGRLITISHPDGALEERAYDPLGNCISKKDPKGYSTRTKYNHRSQPLSIYYPDKSEEHFTYTPTGQRATHQDKNGAITHYSYDIFDHILSEKVYSKEQLLKTRSFVYSPHRLLSSTDPQGVTTHYTYNSFGQKIQEKTEDRIIHFEYDPLGRCICQRRGTTLYIDEYDLLDHLIEQRTEEQGILTRESYTYDTVGNRVQTITSKGHFLTHYNAQKQPILERDPLGFETHYSYIAGQLAQQTNPKGITTHYSYDPRGRVTTIVKKNRQGRIIQAAEQEYDLNGNCIRKSHDIYSGTEYQKSVTHTLSYGPLDHLEVMEEAGRRNNSYSYDSAGRLQTITRPNGIQLHHQYDPLGRVSHLYSTDFDYRYSYDQNDQLLSVQDRITGQTTTRTYDTLGHLIHEHLGNNLTLSNTYNSQGQREEITLPDSTTISYRYHGDQLDTVQRKCAQHSYHRDLDGAITTMTLPHQLGTLCIERDALSRPICMDTAHLTYDSCGNLTSNGIEEFTYDDLDQLISDQEHTYAYDSLNNRLCKDDTLFQFDDLSQRLEYSYDENGNLLNNALWDFSYDTQDRLIEAHNKHCRILYTYDSFHRRLSKTVYLNAKKTFEEFYLWDGENEIGSADRSGKLHELRILGEGLGAEIGAAVLLELNGTTYVPLHDQQGSLITLIDLQGKRKSYHYTPFGEEEQICPSPWRFMSKRKDGETGHLYFGRRYYSPQQGRWLTPDPQHYDDGPNLYAYVHNNPLTHLDLYGLYDAYEFDNYLPNFSFPQGNSTTPFLLDGFENGFGNRSYRYDLQRQDMGIGFINGIKNEQHHAIQTTLMLSQLSGGYNISGVYNASHSAPVDIYESYLNLWKFITTPPAQLLQEMWTQYFEHAPKDAIFLQICHSQGAIHVRNALTNLSEDLRKRIRVVAIAPAAYIDRHLCHSVQHYRVESKNDWVPLLDREGRKRNQHTTKVLKSQVGGWDHAFNSPTYEVWLRREIKDHISKTRGQN